MTQESRQLPHQIAWCHFPVPLPSPVTWSALLLSKPVYLSNGDGDTYLMRASVRTNRMCEVLGQVPGTL